jgi:hypothetical protein
MSCLIIHEGVLSATGPRQAILKFLDKICYIFKIIFSALF